MRSMKCGLAMGQFVYFERAGDQGCGRAVDAADDGGGVTGC